MESDLIYQELTESERRAKDALLLQVRDFSGCCRSRGRLRLDSLLQHEEHLGGGGFSSKDDVRLMLCGVLRQRCTSLCQSAIQLRMLQSERRRAIEVGAGAEPEGDLEEDDDDD